MKINASSPNKGEGESSGELSQVSCCAQNCPSLGARQLVMNLCIRRQNILIIVIHYCLGHAFTALSVLVEAGFCPASDCQEADMGLLTSHRDFSSQVCKSGTSRRACLSELLQNKMCCGYTGSGAITLRFLWLSSYQFLTCC